MCSLVSGAGETDSGVASSLMSCWVWKVVVFLLAHTILFNFFSWTVFCTHG